MQQLEQLTDGGYIRIEDAPGYQFPERIHLASADDTSPMYRGKYDSSCSACYLGGFAHTERRHNRSRGILCAACQLVPPDAVLTATSEGHAVVNGHYGRALACSTAGGY